MTKELLDTKSLMPSKLAAVVSASSVAFFFAAPVLIVLRAEAADGFGPYVIATAFASLFMWLSKRAIEAFSTHLTCHGAEQHALSLRNPLGISKRVVRWVDVSTATTDERYIWLDSAHGSVKVDPEMFWNAFSVHEYIGHHLRPFDVSIVRIASR